MESRQRLLCKSLGAWSCKTKDLIIFIFVWFPYSCSHLSYHIALISISSFLCSSSSSIIDIRDIWDFFSSNLNNEIDFFSPKSPMSQYAYHHSSLPHLATRLSAYEKRPPSPNLSTGKFQLVQVQPKLKGSVWSQPVWSEDAVNFLSIQAATANHVAPSVKEVLWGVPGRS